MIMTEGQTPQDSMRRRFLHGGKLCAKDKLKQFKPQVILSLLSLTNTDLKKRCQENTLSGGMCFY